MATTTAPVSFGEFEALPDRPGKTELLEGGVLAVPPVKRVHGQIARSIQIALGHLLADAGKSEKHAYTEMGYRLGPTLSNWLQPDVSVRRPAQTEGEYFEGAPLLAVEVVSESNAACDLQRKTRLYLENGAHEVWLVYPDDRALWQYLADGTARRQTTAFATEIFPGRRFPLETIWE